MNECNVKQTRQCQCVQSIGPSGVRKSIVSIVGETKSISSGLACDGGDGVLGIVPVDFIWIGVCGMVPVDLNPAGVRGVVTDAVAVVDGRSLIGGVCCCSSCMIVDMS